MKFERPPNTDPLSEVNGTIIIPQSDCDYPEELLNSYMSQLDKRRGTTAVAKPLLAQSDRVKEFGYELDVESLAQLVWEHQQYSQAQKFSVSDIEVLRALQNVSNDQQRVLSSDLSERLDYDDSTISQALTRLEDRKLIKREKRGVFRYKGFTDWTPPTQEDE